MIKALMIILLSEVLIIAILIGLYEIKVLLKDMGVMNELRSIQKRIKKP